MEPRVVCVIVTRNRPGLLAQGLDAVLGQARAPDAVIVIDNGDPNLNQPVMRAFPTVRWVPSRANLGGAGGFAYAMLTAMADDADWIWLMDDDGRPLNADCLGTLLREGTTSTADFVGPMVQDADNPLRLAFPYKIRGRYRFTVAEIENRPVISNQIHLFNGVLICAKSLYRLGLPDMRLFIRGDEVEYLARARQSGAVLLTVTAARFIHPSSRHEIQSMIPGLLHIVLPDNEFKSFYQFRNRGYVLPRRGMKFLFFFDFIRYGLFYLVIRRGQFGAFGNWCGLMFKGLCKRFDHWPGLELKNPALVPEIEKSPETL